MGHACADHYQKCISREANAKAPWSLDRRIRIPVLTRADYHTNTGCGRSELSWRGDRGLQALSMSILPLKRPWLDTERPAWPFRPYNDANVLIRCSEQGPRAFADRRSQLDTFD